MKKLALLASLGFFFLATEPVQAQCPMCKTAVESNRKDGKSKVGNGLNDGILYLLATPYLMVAAAGGIWYYNRQKKLQKEA